MILEGSWVDFGCHRHSHYYLRVRLVVTSNLHFDPDYRGLQQNSILLSSGVSG